ncbi:MAG: polymerase sigma factor RpoE [Candidatus Taylorbacteria bacterium]|nr:polymerase sigma factor RpoE [Candidatus Taylorbacteria bacterium]
MQTEQPQNPSEMELVEKMQAGDKEAFNELMQDNIHYIENICRGHTPHQNMIDDIVQMVMLKVWRFRHQFKKESAFKTWLFTIAIHVTLDANRAEKRHHAGRLIQDEDQGPFIESVPTHASSPSEVAEFGDVLTIINMGFAELSLDHQTIFRLSFIQCMSYLEIARQCNISLGTVSSRIFYVRQYLLGLLSAAGQLKR